MAQDDQGNGSVVVTERPDRSEARPAQPEAFARNIPEPHPVPPKKPLYKRPTFWIVLVILIAGGISGGLLWWLHARQYESTDDAFIQADVTQVSPRVAGHVSGVFVSDNQWVNQGQKLIELDPSDLQAKVNEADAAVVAAEKNLQQARENVLSMQATVAQAQAAEEASKTEADRAHSELKRYESLSAAAVTQQQLVNLRAAAVSADANLVAARQKTVWAQTGVKTADAQVQVAAAQVKQSEAILKEAQLQLSYTHINAAVAGHATNKSVQVGDYVQIGQALLALVPRNVYVIANFKETQLALMKPGQLVTLTIDAYPGKVFNGRVDSIQRGSGAAFSLLPPENATGNYVKVVQRVPLKITFDGEGYVLGPGMSVVPKVKVR